MFERSCRMLRRDRRAILLMYSVVILSALVALGSCEDSFFLFPGYKEAGACTGGSGGKVGSGMPTTSSGNGGGNGGHSSTSSSGMSTSGAASSSSNGGSSSASGSTTSASSSSSGGG